jgi:hypothetical protein
MTSLPRFIAEADFSRPGTPGFVVGSITGRQLPLATQQASCPTYLLHTETACPLGGIFGLWCRDYCGRTPLSWWYPCGFCIGGDL